MAGICTNQLDEQDFRQTYVTREEITQETFNDEGFGAVYPLLKGTP